jgi:MoxR-like ATPase
MAVPSGHGDRVLALLAALVTKPFAILTGLSGSGKTQLALRLGEWFGTGPEQRRMCVVPVRPDWTGPEALFGYEDALRPVQDGRAAWFVPGALEFVLAAAREPELPYLLVLDEMNLAHVERYFSDFLSGVESRQDVVPNLVREDGGEWRVAATGPSTLPIPRNLFVIGTVNVDETTYLFSPKVLDRATTFEVRTDSDELASDRRRPQAVGEAARPLLRALTIAALDDDWQLRAPASFQEDVAASLVALHRSLSATGDEFGHRVFYESLRLAAAFERLGDDSYEHALDQVVMLKLLPRVHGSRRRVEPVLRRLLAFAYAPGADLDAPPDLTRDPRLPLTARKVQRMLSAVAINQFVSFTE